MRATIPAIAACLLAAGCASTSHTTASTPASNAATAKSAAPTPSPTAAAVPDLAAGQTITVTTKPDGVTTTAPGSYQVTLTAIKTATQVTDPGDGYTAKADPGKIIACVALKVRNTSSAPGDLFPFTNPSWQSSSGQVAATDLPMGVNCAAFGITSDDLASAPNPGPGQFATGSDTVEFPAGTGSLVFSDRSGAPMFRVTVPAAG